MIITASHAGQLGAGTRFGISGCTGTGSTFNGGVGVAVAFGVGVAFALGVGGAVVFGPGGAFVLDVGGGCRCGAEMPAFAAPVEPDEDAIAAAALALALDGCDTSCPLWS